MKYIALLRGINVGGNSIIRMADLKTCLLKADFQNVETFIQSGNVIFDSPEREIQKLETRMEETIFKTFKFNTKVLIRSEEQLTRILKEVPKDWKERDDLRCYIVFVKAPTSVEEVKLQMAIKEGVDFVTTGDGVLYAGTLLSGLMQSGLKKLIGKKVYQDITIRNYSTIQKLAALLIKD